MTKKQKKTLFVANYSKLYNKSLSMKGLFSFNTLYKYMDEDPDFKLAIDEVEFNIVHVAESKYFELLNSEDDKVVFKAAKEIINSKLGKKHSQLCVDDKSSVVVNADKTITFKFGNDDLPEDEESHIPTDKSKLIVD